MPEQERKTHSAAKNAICETNAPGFVNDSPYFDPTKPRKAHVKLPCAYLEKPADAKWKREIEFREDVSYEARKAMQHYGLTEMNLYDNDGNILEVIVAGEEATQ